MGKSVFLDISTNYLRKSKQLNYTTWPSANDCQFRFCLLTPAPYICMGRFTKPTFKGLIFTVIWGNTIVTIIVVVFVVSFAATSLQVRRALEAEGYALGHTAGEEPLSQDCPQTLLLCSGSASPFSPLHLAFSVGQGIVPPRGEIWFLEEQKNILTFLMYEAQINRQYINR